MDSSSEQQSVDMAPARSPETSLRPPPDVDPEQVHKAIQSIAGMGPMAVNLALILWFWGQWPKVLSVVAVGVVLTVANVVVLERLAKRLSRPVVETLWMLLNVVGLSVNGHFTGWPALLWVFVPYAIEQEKLSSLGMMAAGVAHEINNPW